MFIVTVSVYGCSVYCRPPPLFPAVTAGMSFSEWLARLRFISENDIPAIPSCLKA